MRARISGPDTQLSDLIFTLPMNSGVCRLLSYGEIAKADEWGEGAIFHSGNFRGQ